MIDAFVEGVRSITQVCHLVILAPVGLMVVAARGRWTAVAGAIAGVVLGGWIFAANWFGPITDSELRVSAVFVIVDGVVLGVPRLLGRNRSTWRGRIGSTLQSGGGTASVCGLVGVVVVQWWRPCVGTELGSILTAAPGDPWGELLPTMGFMLGISTPLMVLGSIYAVWSPSTPVARRLGWVGAAGVCVLAVSVVAGQHGEIVSRLFEWSQ
ncbi:hypothetical protein [Ilumatobacter nonamiensis]|uniref:hypothetical protein n=1 Tax=Ilumatobacter nonamiensis TaxID=467093 RepID=UPI00034688F3|nr:hypothetical protein [Ilumatobacter nonamiensis]